MYAVLDTFNNRIISRHRSVGAAVAANARFQRMIKRNNGATSYIPVVLRKVDKDGDLLPLDPDSPEMMEWSYGDL